MAFNTRFYTVLPAAVLGPPEQFIDNDPMQGTAMSRATPRRAASAGGAWAGLLLAVTLPFAAQAEVLSFDASVAEAAAHNADLQSARASLQAAGYNASGAYAGFLPQVSAGMTYSHNTGSLVSTTSTPGGPTTVVSGEGDSYTTSLSVNQNLFAGFQDSAKVQQGDARRVVAESNYALALANVSQALKSAFAQLKYAQDSVTLADSIVRRLEENVRLVGLRYDSGRENKGSYLLTRASLAQARFDRLQAGQALITARGQLARALGRREADGLEVSGDVPTSEPVESPDFAQLARATPRYRQATAQERDASAGVTLARSAFYPNVNLTGSLSRVGNDWFPGDERRSVGVNLTIPLYDGGRDYYATRSASASLEAAVSDKDSAEHQTLVSLKQTHADYVQSVEQLKVSQAFLDAAQARAEIGRSQYNNGLISFSDWNLIENDLIQRQKNLVQSQRDRVIAEAAWEQALGKGAIP
jgi:outer membrane protein TolC